MQYRLSQHHWKDCGITPMSSTLLDTFGNSNRTDAIKKIKIKLLKKFVLFNLKHIWIGEKNNNKNCMILHCKNAEMTIILSFLHFYSVKSYNFCYFFFNKLTRNKNARHIFPHHCFPIAMIGIICLHMHFLLYTLNTRSIFFKYLHYFR